VSSRPRPRQLATEQRGRLGDLGQDHDQGHLTYVEKLEPGGRLWLRTKPFSAPPNVELAQCLRTFAHVIELLQLGLRAQVLDVGCGPGWMSEFLARCGYWVTGVDISPDMTEIARARVDAISGPVGEGLEPLAEFHAMPVREMPWTSRFDAAVLYDTMHHFDNELETLQVVRNTLVPGGQLYIHEGVKPPPGSEAERNLVAEMERFGTLESPFDPDYLVAVVEQAGFVDVRRLTEVDELVDLAPAGRRRDRILERLVPDRLRARALRQASLRAEFNIVHAFNPIPAGATGRAAFTAMIETDGDWEPAGPDLTLRLRVTNTGRAFWPAGRWYPYPNGSVTLGTYVVGSEQERGRELGRSTLPRSISPGETVAAELRIRRAELGEARLAVDMVREGVFWFSEAGSEPLVLPPAAV
jgi:SAM-dependent methyltransferase